MIFLVLQAEFTLPMTTMLSSTMTLFSVQPFLNKFTVNIYILSGCFIIIELLGSSTIVSKGLRILDCG